MKRTITIILALTMLLSLVSCGTGGNPDPSPAPTGEAGVSSSVPTAAPIVSPTDKPEETPGESTDFPAADLNSIFANRQFEPAFETEDSIYYVRSFSNPNENYITRYMICVTDKEYKDWMPLCGRPNCMHDNDDCSAWIEGHSYNKIWLYGERIYYAFYNDGNPELWRMKLDGTDHERMLGLSLPDPDDDLSYSWSWTFHNKYLIANYRKEEGLNGYETTTYVVDLSARKLEQRKLDAYLETGEKTFVGYCVAGKDNIVYHWQSKNVEITDPVSGETRTKAITSLYKTDLETGATSKLCVLPFQPFFGDSSLEGDLLYFCESTDENIILTVNTETGELTTVNTAELYSVCWVTPYHGYIFGTIDRKSSAPDGTPFENLGTFIYDLSGELVCSIPYESYSADIYILFALGDLVFGVERSDVRETLDSLFPTWYLDLSEMGTENFVWHRWES